jgi:hypothetical protein
LDADLACFTRHGFPRLSSREPHSLGLQVVCVSSAQDLADTLSRDCRQIVASGWYRQLFGATARDVRVREHGTGLPAHHLGRGRADRLAPTSSSSSTTC